MSELIDYDDTDTGKQQSMATTTANFNDFLLRDEIMKIIGEVAFEHPSEVQQKCIPKAILGVDVLCQAKSGTGKTAVFVISTLQQFTAVKGETAVIVIVHTREMAMQVRDEYRRFLKYFGDVRAECFLGGVPVIEDAEKLRVAPAIAIGTPGRMHDLVQRGLLKTKSVKFFVVDEVDQIIGDLKMRWDVQRIFTSCEKEKQCIFLSATLSEVREDCLKFLRDPHEIIIEEKKLTLHGLSQFYSIVNDKLSALSSLLDNTDFNQCIVFIRNKDEAKRICAALKRLGFPTVEIHSGMSVEDRRNNFNSFKKLNFRILVSTDLMSRGIDVQDINLVVNCDVPDSPDTYLHRVGRAGRFETVGTAVTFLSNDYDKAVINEVQKKFEVEIKEMLIK